MLLFLAGGGSSVQLLQSCRKGGASTRKPASSSSQAAPTCGHRRRGSSRSLQQLRIAAFREDAAAGVEKSKPQRKKAVIAGAGPAGSLSAIYLARQGWDVTVCDRRSSPAEAFTASNIQAYNICLNARGVLVCQPPGGRKVTRHAFMRRVVCLCSTTAASTVAATTRRSTAPRCRKRGGMVMLLCCVLAGAPRCQVVICSTTKKFLAAPACPAAALHRRSKRLEWSSPQTSA